MKVYLFQASGNAYKVRILLGLLNVPYERVVLDSKNQEHKQPAYLKINPRGEVPAIDDDGTVIWDSAACLAYIARKYGGGDAMDRAGGDANPMRPAVRPARTRSGARDARASRQGAGVRPASISCDGGSAQE